MKTGRPYRAWEVMGLELEYPVVDRDLRAVPLVPDVLTALTGRPRSDASLGLIGISNEIFQHVLELKNEMPLRSIARIEETLAEGVRQMGGLLADRFGAQLLPGGMHPWFDPREARLWERSNRRIYQTYSRLFNVRTHGWANVQAVHVNLPLGSDAEAVAMMNAARLLVPYLPALSASSPMYEGRLQPAVDNRLRYIIEHQARLPESSGDIVPEEIGSLSGYKKDVLGRMYEAVDRLEGAGALRQEFLNARGAVFKFSRHSMEVRVLDVQECVRMDTAIAAFTRRALRHLARRMQRLPAVEQGVLVEDFRAVVKEGSRARVRAPHLGPKAARDADGRLLARDALRALFEESSRRATKEEQPYLDLVAGIIESGSLSERIRAVLEPLVGDETRFDEQARQTWKDLATCLLENRPWSGR